MILKKKIPKEFYKLFRTKNRDAYMQFLVAIYEENNEVYTALGLTIEECRVIIADTIALIVTNGFDLSSNLNFLEGWITALS